MDTTKTVASRGSFPLRFEGKPTSDPPGVGVSFEPGDSDDTGSKTHNPIAVTPRVPAAVTATTTATRAAPPMVYTTL